jgi:filamentous hemagglutinin family protein
VIRGSATITSAPTVPSLLVQQSSSRAVIDWNTFNIGNQASVRFIQPDANAITLNRVLDTNPSQIQGRLTANGQVFISNPQGIYFSSTAQVDVGGLVASTHSLSPDDFMAGSTVWQRQGANAAVVNEGTLRARLGGYIALLAPEVRNQGVVVAQAGTVALASGEAITLQLGGQHLSGLTTTPQAIAALVENRQAVLVEGGYIVLSANALSQLQGGVVRNSGQLKASSISDQGGLIVLEGGEINLSSTSHIEANGPRGGGTVLVGGDWQGQGTTRQATTVTIASGASIEASATQQGSGGQIVLFSDLNNAQGLTSVQGSLRAEGGPVGGNGGRIETSGHRLAIGDMQVSTRAAQGTNGQWLLDPYNVTISNGVATNMDSSNNATGTGAIVNNTTLSTALGSGNVTVTTGSTGNESGNITVANDINWSSANSLTLTAAGNITLNAALNNTSTGNITLNAAGTGGISGNASGNIQIGPTTGTALTDPGGRLTFNVSNANGTGIYAGTISGNGQLIKTGLGTVQLDGANTFKGGTSVQSGTIAIVGTGVGSDTSNSLSALGASGAAVEVQTNGTVSLTNVVSNWVGPTWKLSGAGNINLISSGANNYAILSATETTVSGPASSFTGTINASGNGYNFLSNSNFSNAVANVTTTGYGLFLPTGGSLMLGELSGHGTIHASASSGGTDTLIVGGKNTNSTFSGLLSNYTSGGSNQKLAFKKVGTGTLTLSTLSIYTGATTVSAGTLLIDRPASLYNGTPANWTTGNIIVASGATLAVNVGGSPFPFTSSYIDTLASLGSSVGGFLNGSYLGLSTTYGDFTYNSALRNPNGGINTLGLVKLGNNTLTMTGASTYTGATIVNAGTLKWQVASAGTTTTLTGDIINNANIAFDGSLSTGRLFLQGNISGAGTWTVDNTVAPASIYDRRLVIHPSNNKSVTTTGAVTLNNYGALWLDSPFANSLVNTSSAINLNGPNTRLVLYGVNGSTIKIGTLTGSGIVDFPDTTAGSSLIFSTGNDNGSGAFSGRLENTVGQLTIEKAGTGTQTLTTSNTYSGGTRVSGGTLQINEGGSLGAGDVLLSNNATLTYQRSSDTVIANTITGNGNVRANISANGSLTVNNAISLTTGTIELTTANADVTVNQAVSTGSTSGTVLTLKAGQSSLAGTSTGGDIKLQGSGSLGVGAGAQGLLYLGSVSGSSGLAGLIGSGSGRFRYNSDATTSNFATPLSGSGLYAIYRESPSLTVSLNNGVIDYNGSNYSGGQGYTLIGLRNGDTQAQSVSGVMAYGGTAQGARNANASPYTLTGSGLSSPLGYQLSYTSASLTIQPLAASVTATLTPTTYNGNTQTQTATTSGFVAGDSITVSGLASGRNAGTYTSNLSVSGNDASNYTISLNNANLSIARTTLTLSAISDSKSYDGTTASSQTPTVVSGLQNGDTVSSLSQAFASKNVLGANASTLQVSAYSVNDSNGGNNYTVVSNTATGTITPVNLTVKANDDAKFVTRQDAVGYAGATATGLVNNESLASLGPLSITRSNSANNAAGDYQNVLQPSGLTSSNYNITYAPGLYSIVPADQLLVRMTNLSTLYGNTPNYAVSSAQYLDSGNNLVVDLTLNTTVQGAHVQVTDGASGQATFTVGAMNGSYSSAQKLNVGSYTQGASDVQITSNNFNNQLSVVGRLDVQPKSINLSAPAGWTKAYDGTRAMPAFAVNAVGALLGDQLRVNGAAQLDSPNVGSGLTYNVTALSLAGLDSANYTLGTTTSFQGNNATITPAAPPAPPPSSPSSPASSSARTTLIWPSNFDAKNIDTNQNSESENAVAPPPVKTPATNYLVQNLSELRQKPTLLGNTQVEHIRVLINPHASSIEIPFTEIFHPTKLTPSTRIALRPTQGSSLPKWLELHPNQQTLRLTDQGRQAIDINVLLSTGTQHVLMELRGQ